MPNSVAASCSLVPEKSHSQNSKSGLALKKRQETTPTESIKCSTKLFGSATVWELKVGSGRSFKPSKLRPWSSSVRLRSSATSKLGWAPNEAKTPPVRGFIKVTHI